jgi:5-methylcytosine-specific restriction protein A
MSKIHEAYLVARQVFAGAQSLSAGSKQLQRDHGFNIHSARDTILAYRHLMRGEVFQRALSAPDMEHFLTRITIDSGAVALRTALHSLWLHIGYYEGVRKVTLHKLRGVAASFQARAAAPAAAEDVAASFAKAVARSLSDSPERRQKRLQAAARLPSRSPVLVLAFDRNPDVVAEVLLRASGKCERCAESAPFLRRKDKTPYLEVHHRVQLADGGEDTVANAQALCPNCHRELHYGA